MTAVQIAERQDREIAKAILDSKNDVTKRSDEMGVLSMRQMPQLITIPFIFTEIQSIGVMMLKYSIPHDSTAVRKRSTKI
jgi:hypothetical protein